jgi:hypothetical protein
MARRPGSSGLSLHPAGPHGHFPLPLPLVLAILPPLTGNAGDYTDNVPHYRYSKSRGSVGSIGSPSCGRMGMLLTQSATK